MSGTQPVVVDADSHLQQPLQWLAKKFPDMGMAVREPTSFSPVKYFVPEEHWPEDESRMYTEPWLRFLENQRQAFADGVDLDDMVADPDVDLGALDRLFRGRGGWDTDERVTVLDELGIDVQLASGISLRMGSGAEWRHLTALGNTVTLEQVGRHHDRIIPIVDIDLTDLDWAIDELTRCRGLGSRVFNIPVEPVNGKSLTHPDNDRLWAAASDLGMLGYLHSFNDPLDADWANNGGDYMQLSMLSSVRYHHQAEMLLTVLCAGGVFERFPNFGVVMAEIGGLAWIPNALQWMDAHVTDPSLREMQAIEPWTYDLLPSEYAQRQVRVAPLPNESQSPVPWLEQLGDIAVFSTDYPHPEGTPDPKVQGPDAATNFFRDELAGVDPARRDRFFGEALAELFARGGDPLTGALASAR
jgi:predicted TIM-barrel fold metal-dependent hydrolase